MIQNVTLNLLERRDKPLKKMSKAASPSGQMLVVQDRGGADFGKGCEVVPEASLTAVGLG